MIEEAEDEDEENTDIQRKSMSKKRTNKPRAERAERSLVFNAYLRRRFSFSGLFRWLLRLQHLQ